LTRTEPCWIPVVRVYRTDEADLVPKLCGADNRNWLGALQRLLEFQVIGGAPFRLLYHRQVTGIGQNYDF
jgi:hypothetical protein